MAVLIGIDVGTTNWKVAAFTQSGELICVHKMPTRTHYMENGCGYYEPKEMWGCFCDLLRRTAADCAGQQILGVSVTSMAESIVPVNREGEELFPIIAWFDASPRDEAKHISDTFGEDEIFRRFGLDPDPIFPLPKMMWIRKLYPQVYDKAYKWLQMADYIYYKLCGVFATDYTLACRTLAFHMEKRDWDMEVMDAFHIHSDAMPDLYTSGSYIGGIHLEASALTGLPVGTPVYAGGHDHPCATLASGAMNGRKIMDSSGTAEAFLMVSEPGAPIPQKRQGQRVGLHLDPRRYVLWGGIKASGASADWGYEVLTTRMGWTGEKETIDYAKIAQKLEQIPLGCEGAMYIPHLRGSGAPTWNTMDRGGFVGLRSQHTAPYLMRAVFEGLSCQARIIIEMHQQISGVKAESLCVAGGSTKNRFWQQLKADIVGIPVEICPMEEATVQGAALLAAVGAGVYSSIEEAATAASRGNMVLYPNPHRAEKCEKLFRRYNLANNTLCALHRELARMQ